MHARLKESRKNGTWKRKKICGEGEGGNQCPSLATLFNSAYPFISDVGIAKGRDGCIAIHERCQMS